MRRGGRGIRKRLWWIGMAIWKLCRGIRQAHVDGAAAAGYDAGAAARSIVHGDRTWQRLNVRRRRRPRAKLGLHRARKRRCVRLQEPFPGNHDALERTSPPSHQRSSSPLFGSELTPRLDIEHACAHAHPHVIGQSREPSLARVAVTRTRCPCSQRVRASLLFQDGWGFDRRTQHGLLPTRY